MLHNVLSVGAGMVGGSVVIFLVEMLGHQLYPPPQTSEDLSTYIANMPLAPLLMVLLGWFLGALAGGFITAKIAAPYQQRLIYILGILFTVVAVINMLTIPHPIFMWVAGTLIFLPAVFLGAKLATISQA